MMVHITTDKPNNKIIVTLKWLCQCCGTFPTCEINNEKYTTIKCKCRMRIIYPSGLISVIPFEAYKKDYGSKN